MKKLVYGFLLLAIAVSSYFLFKPEVEDVSFYVVKPSLFIESMRHEGRVRSQMRHTVFAYATGVLGDIKVQIGDSVKKGEILALLDWDRKEMIKSPVDGVVTRIYRNSYGPINRGESILEVSSFEDLEVVVDMLTPEALRLSVGGEVKIENWGREESISGVVNKISRAGAVKISALGIEEERTEVTIKPLKKEELKKNSLGDNYHVDVLFELSRVEDGISIPLSALFKADRNWAVFLIDKDRIKMRPVVLGAKNDFFVLIREGLKPDDKIVDFPGDQLSEGQRVRLRQDSEKF